MSLHPRVAVYPCPRVPVSRALALSTRDSFDTLSLLVERSMDLALSLGKTNSQTRLSDAYVIKATRLWVERVVVGLNLCPFARRELETDRVRFAVTGAESEEALLADLHHEIELLLADLEMETTLLIHPRALENFIDYNLFLDTANRLLQELDLEGELQIASFHPDYCFADAEPEAGENFTNRSPFPMLHLLREESVSRAVESHPDVDGIPARNVRLLNDMGAQQLATLREACTQDA